MAAGELDLDQVEEMLFEGGLRSPGEPMNAVMHTRGGSIDRMCTESGIEGAYNGTAADCNDDHARCDDRRRRASPTRNSRNGEEYRRGGYDDRRDRGGRRYRDEHRHREAHGSSVYRSRERRRRYDSSERHRRSAAFPSSTSRRREVAVTDEHTEERTGKENGDDGRDRVNQEFQDRRQREMDEARRDDQTVLVLNLSLKVTERVVWKFFSENCGKVRDIQVIRDSRSGKSKGVGYVEFFTQEAVMKALALSGQVLEGCAIKVQASQAEKNRAARLAKQQAVEAAEGGPVKVYVGGLVDSLANITEEELRQLFTPFGDVAHVDLHKDPYTGKCRGFAFVQFCKATDASEAMAAMNGFEIAGRAIRVGFATESIGGGTLPQPPPLPHADGSSMWAGLRASLAGAQLGGTYPTLAHQIAAAQAAAALVDDTPDSERLDDEGGGLLSGATTRLALMQKLQRHEGADISSATSLASALAGRSNTSLATATTAARYW